MGLVEVLWDGVTPQKGQGTSGSIMEGRWGTRYVDRQTPVKTVPSRRTTYAGGNHVHKLFTGNTKRDTNGETTLSMRLIYFMVNLGVVSSVIQLNRLISLVSRLLLKQVKIIPFAGSNLMK